MTTSVRNGSFHAILRARRRSAPPAIRRLSSAVKVPLDAITDRLRESEDADYCAAAIERLQAVIAEFEPPACPCPAQALFLGRYPSKKCRYHRHNLHATVLKPGTRTIQVCPKDG